MKNFKELSEREILALAISLEEEDERVYADFFEGLRQDYSGSAAVFDSMRKEESEHRRRLIELYREKFGDHIPLIRRQDVKDLSSAHRCGWCVHWGWTPFASRRALLKLKRAGSMNKPQHVRRTPASASFSMISRKRNARTKIELRNLRKKIFVQT